MLDSYVCFSLFVIVCCNFSFCEKIPPRPFKPHATYNYTEFPKSFKFGVGSSAYQIEGGWNASGKSESIWDYAIHKEPWRIQGEHNADIACDSYHRPKSDLAILKQLKVNCYRFSISWPRIFPLGYATNPNPDGVRYYNQLINELIANDISPMITLYHWDLPQSLQDLGGWANPAIADVFADYADKVFGLFGDRVKTWTTFNEPSHVCKNGYNGFHAPFLSEDGIGTYLCSHTLLRAHGMTYRLYQKKYKQSQKGVIGIATETDWYEPLDAKREADKESIAEYMEMNLGWFVHPIYSESGDYPPVMRKRIDYVSKMQNYSKSRLPHFTQEEIDYIRGSYDFLGINHYTTFLLTSANIDVPTRASYASDANVILSQNASWEHTGWEDFKVVPEGIRKLLIWIGERYGYDIPIAITENGYVGYDGESLNDDKRINYINKYISEVLAAMNSGIKVISYNYWALTDNFEWTRGYTLKFGLYYIDFTDSKRSRRAKKSALVYRNIAMTRRVDFSFNPKYYAHV